MRTTATEKASIPTSRHTIERQQADGRIKCSYSAQMRESEIYATSPHPRSQHVSSYDMKKNDHLGLVAQAILAELAQGHPCSAEELAHALQRHGHEATLTSVCRNVDDLRDRKWVAFVQPTSEEAEWAIEDAAKIASRMRGETAAPMRYTPRFVMTPLGRKNGDASHRSG